MTTTPISLGLLDSWLEGWAIAVSGIADCASTSLRRGPPDVVRWTELMAMRQPPSWATPNEVVLETPLARLRDFSASAVGAPLPEDAGPGSDREHRWARIGLQEPAPAGV